MDGAADVFAFVEHGKDLVNHGGDDVVFAGELVGGASGGAGFAAQERLTVRSPAATVPW
jgi:hypothetical protein